MKNNKIIYVSSILIIIFCVSFKCFAYDDGRTHPHIAKDALSESQLHTFLQEYFDLEEDSSVYGPDTRLNNKSVVELFQEGSKEEDSPLCRAANHFHNPLVPDTDTWDNGKLTDTSGAINWYCDNLSLPDDQDIRYPSSEVTSNLTWGTGFISHDQKDSYILEKNIWDWESAREYYFTAVTGLTSFAFRDDYLRYGYTNWKTDNDDGRNEYLEKTLIAVGHVAHMLQDAAVPAHVRNDFAQGHTMILLGLDKPTKWLGNSYETYLRRNDDNPNKKFWKDIPKRSQRPIPIFQLTDLWDTDQFNSGFDGVSVDMDSLGLAEYTNLNFFSEYTRFSTDFPFPKKEHITEIYDKPHADSLFDRKYFATTSDHPGEQIQHLSTVSVLFSHLARNAAINGLLPPLIWIPPRKLPLYFDSKCYDEYASKLIPRAVGFSADLIDYFFRGRIEVSPIMPQDLIIRGNGQGDVFISAIKATLKNVIDEIKDPDDNPLFPNEEMQEGYLCAQIKYEDVDGHTVKYLSKSIDIRSEDNNLIKTTPSEYEFDFSKDPIPWNATNIELLVIFKGTIGAEEDIAVAVGRQQLKFTKMRVSPPSEYVYSILDASDFEVAQPQTFTTLKASLQDIGLYTSIKSGTLTAIALYRELVNYVPSLTGASSTPPSASDRKATQSFAVSEPQNVNSIPWTTTQEFTFNIPIPAGITDLYLLVVFNGNVLNTVTGDIEPNATVVGIKDLNEPQHLTYWNNTDYFLLNGYPQTAQWIRDNDPNFINNQDYKGYGFIDPHNIIQAITFSESETTTTVPPLFDFYLEPGQYGKVIILTETPPISSAVTDFVQAPDTDNTLLPQVYRYFSPRTINQLNQDGIWQSTYVSWYRGVYQHNWTFFINVHPFYQFEFLSPMPLPDNDLKPVKASHVYFP